MSLQTCHLICSITRNTPPLSSLFPSSLRMFKLQSEQQIYRLVKWIQSTKVCSANSADNEKKKLEKKKGGRGEKKLSPNAMGEAAITAILLPESWGDLNFTRSRNAIQPTAESKWHNRTSLLISTSSACVAVKKGIFLDLWTWRELPAVCVNQEIR